MPKIDFYLLEETREVDRDRFACRLIEKVYKQNRRIFIYVSNEQAANALDELLWTYRDDSFLPHHIQGEGPNPPPPIQIGFNTPPAGERDILLNLSNSVPEFFTRFSRVLEIVPNDPTAKEILRKLYREYRAKGFEITTHQLQTVEA
jgi:DNA polymerase-3 subunit chi